MSDFFSNEPTVVSFSATYTQNQCHILYSVLLEPVYILPAIVFYLRYCLERCMYITHLNQKNTDTVGISTDPTGHVLITDVANSVVMWHPECLQSSAMAICTTKNWNRNQYVL